MTGQPVQIARGSCGDCCVWCGRVGIDLPVEHDCRPNVSAEEVLGNLRPIIPIPFPAATMMDAALDYAGQAHAVFPCRARDVDERRQAKAPLTRNGWHDATCDPDQIKAWWTQWPDAMVGGPVPDGQVVIDLDPYHGGDLAELEKIAGPLPATLTAWSGRNDGGRHLYFERPAGLLTSSRLPKGFDLRDGGKHYCILPPSIHPVTGRAYRWEQHAAAELPEGLVTLLRPLVTEYRAPEGLPTAGKLAGILRRMGQEKTNRNNVLLWCTCRLIENGYPQDAFDALASVARATGLPDWEVEKVMNVSAPTQAKAAA